MGGRKSPFPITLAIGLYNSLYYRTSRDLQLYQGVFLPRDTMHKRGLCRHAVFVCLSVCVSVRFVSCVKTNKDIFKIFSSSGSQAIPVFPCQTGWRYSDGNPPNGGVECRWGRQKNAILDEYLTSLHTDLQCCQPNESRSVKKC